MVSYVQSLIANFVSAYYRMAATKKIQLLLVSSTSRSDLLCFGIQKWLWPELFA